MSYINILTLSCNKMSKFKFVSIKKDTLNFLVFDTVTDHAEIERTMDHFTLDIPYEMSSITKKPMKFFFTDDVHMKILYRAALKTPEVIMPFHFALLVQGVTFRSLKVFTVCLDTLCIWSRFRLHREMKDFAPNERLYFYVLARKTLHKFFYCLGKNENFLHGQENLHILNVIFSEIVFALVRYVKCFIRSTTQEICFIKGNPKYNFLYGARLDNENTVELTYEKYILLINQVFINPELFEALMCTRILAMVGKVCPFKKNIKHYEKIMNFKHTAKKEKDYCRRVLDSFEHTTPHNDNIKEDTKKEKVTCTGLLTFLCALRDEHYSTNIGWNTKYINVLKKTIEDGRMSSCKIYLPTETNYLLDIRNAFPLKILKRKK